jgi:hypothetical protein
MGGRRVGARQDERWAGRLADDLARALKQIAGGRVSDQRPAAIARYEIKRGSNLGSGS